MSGPELNRILPSGPASDLWEDWKIIPSQMDAIQAQRRTPQRNELPRVYRRVKLSEDEPYGREEEDIALFA